MMSLESLKNRLPWKRKTVNLTDYDPVYKVVYLGNVLTPWAKGEGCVDKPLSTLWRNYCSNVKHEILMKLTICKSGLKAVTREHGLTEYWNNRITFCFAHPKYPRVFCWIYRHEGRKLKQELRCHAVLVHKEGKAGDMATHLTARIALALNEFKREKRMRQNTRLIQSRTSSCHPLSDLHLYCTSDHATPTSAGDSDSMRTSSSSRPHSSCSSSSHSGSGSGSHCANNVPSSSSTSSTHQHHHGTSCIDGPIPPVRLRKVGSKSGHHRHTMYNGSVSSSASSSTSSTSTNSSSRTSCYTSNNKNRTCSLKRDGSTHCSNNNGSTNSNAYCQIPTRKKHLVKGQANFRPPLERSKSAPRLTSIDELMEDEEDEDDSSSSDDDDLLSVVDDDDRVDNLEDDYEISPFPDDLEGEEEEDEVYIHPESTASSSPSRTPINVRIESPSMHETDEPIDKEDDGSIERKPSGEGEDAGIGSLTSSSVSTSSSSSSSSSSCASSSGRNEDRLQSMADTFSADSHQVDSLVDSINRTHLYIPGPKVTNSNIANGGSNNNSFNQGDFATHHLYHHHQSITFHEGESVGNASPTKGCKLQRSHHLSTSSSPSSSSSPSTRLEKFSI